MGTSRPPHRCWGGRGPQGAARGTRLLGFRGRQGPGGRNQALVGKRPLGRREAVACDWRGRVPQPRRTGARGGAGAAESGQRGLRGLRIALQNTTAQTRGPRAHLQNRSTSPIASSVPSAISKDVSQTGRRAPSSHTREEGRDASGRSREVRGQHLHGGSGRRWPARGAGGASRSAVHLGTAATCAPGRAPRESLPSRQNPDAPRPPTDTWSWGLVAPTPRINSGRGRGGGGVSHAHREGRGQGWSVPHLPPSLPRCVLGARCLSS